MSIQGKKFDLGKWLPLALLLIGVCAVTGFDKTVMAWGEKLLAAGEGVKSEGASALSDWLGISSMGVTIFFAFIVGLRFFSKDTYELVYTKLTGGLVAKLAMILVVFNFVLGSILSISEKARIKLGSVGGQVDDSSLMCKLRSPMWFTPAGMVDSAEQAAYAFVPYADEEEQRLVARKMQCSIPEMIAKVGLTKSVVQGCVVAALFGLVCLGVYHFGYDGFGQFAAQGSPEVIVAEPAVDGLDFAPLDASAMAFTGIEQDVAPAVEAIAPAAPSFDGPAAFVPASLAISQ